MELKRRDRAKVLREMVDVVVNHLSQVFFFLLFLGIVLYANEVKTKEKIKIT